MAIIRNYTTIEQSRKLAEILPIESADMCYPKDAFEYDYAKEPVSGGLDEAASNYSEEHRIAFMDYETGEIEMNKSLDILNAFKAGAEWKKEQMMAKAVETTFNVSLPSGLYDKLWIKGCKESDKLLVVKKDEL